MGLAESISPSGHTQGSQPSCQERGQVFFDVFEQSPVAGHRVDAGQWISKPNDIVGLMRYEAGVAVDNQGTRLTRSGFSIRSIAGDRGVVKIDGITTSGAFSCGSYSNASRDFVKIDALSQRKMIRRPASALFESGHSGDHGTLLSATAVEPNYSPVYRGGSEE
ncbi:MAG: TonB-dependent receptor plug domain-containing protein [Pseudomonadota bacterium]